MGLRWEWCDLNEELIFGFSSNFEASLVSTVRMELGSGSRATKSLFVLVWSEAALGCFHATLLCGPNWNRLWLLQLRVLRAPSAFLKSMVEPVPVRSR